MKEHHSNDRTLGIYPMLRIKWFFLKTLAWQKMSHCICDASLFDFFNDCPVATVGEELAAHNLESEDGGAGGRREAAFLQTLLQDHVTHQAGPIGRGLPWYWMLKKQNSVSFTFWFKMGAKIDCLIIKVNMFDGTLWWLRYC